ncbi:hypothetical protein [Bacillus sinesaloumensis]|uniref:hypothetical protein n=1 Tax=Litchfieldia sinesaloumensis TaxID=1926280 RepID=UPI000988601F|nr:hypothetical protein [Bacillus sinesaloumensis]
MKYKALFIFIAALLVVGAVWKIMSNTQEEEYPEVKEQFVDYLTKTHDLMISSGFVYKSGRSTNGVKEGDFIGVFYDERDPSFMIQLSIDQQDNSVRDTFDSKTFRIRQEIFDVMNTYRKDNEFNGYLSFSPEGIRGPNLTSVSYGRINPTISYSVIREEIDIEKELESDYLIAKEVNEIVNKHYDMDLNRVGVTYFEKNGFNFESYLEQFKKNYGEDIYGSSITNYGHLHKPHVYGVKNVSVPKRVFEFGVSTFEEANYRLRLDSLEQFKMEAKRNYTEQYKKTDTK